MERKRKQKGITIIEIMIAMVVVAIALVQVMSVIIHTTNVKQSTRELVTAREAAANQFSILRAQDFDTVSFNFDNTTFDVDGLSNNTNPSGSGLGTILIDDSNPDLLDIQIVITYDRLGGTQTYQARMLLTK